MILKIIDLNRSIRKHWFRCWWLIDHLTFILSVLAADFLIEKSVAWVWLIVEANHSSVVFKLFRLHSEYFKCTSWGNDGELLFNYRAKRLYLSFWKLENHVLLIDKIQQNFGRVCTHNEMTQLIDQLLLQNPLLIKQVHGIGIYNDNPLFFANLTYFQEFCLEKWLWGFIWEQLLQQFLGDVFGFCIHF